MKRYRATGELLAFLFPCLVIIILTLLGCGSGGNGGNSSPSTSNGEPWTTKRAMPMAHVEYPPAAVVNGKVYVIGGRFSQR